MVKTLVAAILATAFLLVSQGCFESQELLDYQERVNPESLDEGAIQIVEVDGIPAYETLPVGRPINGYQAVQLQTVLINQRGKRLTIEGVIEVKPGSVLPEFVWVYMTDRPTSEARSKRKVFGRVSDVEVRSLESGRSVARFKVLATGPGKRGDYWLQICWADGNQRLSQKVMLAAAKVEARF